MAQTAYAYNETRVRRAPEPQRPYLRSIPGRNQGTEARPAAASLVQTMLVVCACCFVFAMAVGFVNVGVSNATVQILMSSDTLSAQIYEARAAGHELDVQHSLAANPVRIQDAAKLLGMVPSDHVTTLEAHSEFNPAVLDVLTAAAVTQNTTDNAALEGIQDEEA